MNLREKLINIIHDSSIPNDTENKTNIEMLGSILNSYCEYDILFEYDITLEELTEWVNDEYHPIDTEKYPFYDTKEEMIEQFKQAYDFYVEYN